jgi:uncharacterized alpha-E superfamily protein
LEEEEEFKETFCSNEAVLQQAKMAFSVIAAITVFLQKTGDEQKADAEKLLLSPTCCALPASLLAKLEEHNPAAAKVRAARKSKAALESP